MVMATIRVVVPGTVILLMKMAIEAMMQKTYRSMVMLATMQAHSFRQKQQ
jgi:hypothetical protein